MIKPMTWISFSRVTQTLTAEARDSKNDLLELVKTFREQANRFEAMARDVKAPEPVKQPVKCLEGWRMY